MSTYVPISPITYLRLSSNIYHFSYLSFYYICIILLYMYTYLCPPSYLFEPTYLVLPTYAYLPTCIYLSTHVNLPSSIYLYKSLNIAADPVAGIGLDNQPSIIYFHACAKSTWLDLIEFQICYKMGPIFC